MNRFVTETLIPAVLLTMIALGLVSHLISYTLAYYAR